ncbi:PREDICTED: peroxidase 56-like [Populus euphratica]|uniref:peroxidase n=1 Tax=Populus euphratica TaxID=75702 RepID=A0AAJ6UBU1_POPEU|nr:PREDICTED: peroxidase 56-like [Populus euphratica]
MAIQKLFLVCFLQLVFAFLLAGLTNAGGLQLGFYQGACPDAELIVHQTLYRYISRDRTLAAPLLRMHFHDCFIRYVSDIITIIIISMLPCHKSTWKSNVFILFRKPHNSQQFAATGLSVKDLSVLSGGHTIGIGHCTIISNRLYNFTGKGDTDPSLDRRYAAQLKKKCKPGNSNTVVEMDPGSFKTFDEDYYTIVAKRRGLFRSDAALLDDAETRDYVQFQSRTQGSTFAQDFAESMVKMGYIGVLTGKQGEIRKRCAVVN